MALTSIREKGKTHKMQKEKFWISEKYQICPTFPLDSCKFLWPGLGTSLCRRCLAMIMSESRSDKAKFEAFEHWPSSILPQRLSWVKNDIKIPIYDGLQNWLVHVFAICAFTFILFIGGQRQNIVKYWILCLKNIYSNFILYQSHAFRLYKWRPN